MSKPTRKRRKKGDKDYINNKDFTAEIIKCKQTGELSDQAVEYFMILANRAVDRLTYKDYRDREDCIQSALLDCIKYWKSFDETRGNPPNAFAYFTQMCKHGYAKEWKNIHHKRGLDDGEKVDTISLNYTGDNSIYTI